MASSIRNHELPYALSFEYKRRLDTGMIFGFFDSRPLRVVAQDPSLDAFASAA
jgi:hypothetical protein